MLTCETKKSFPLFPQSQMTPSTRVRAPIASGKFIANLQDGVSVFRFA